MGNGYSKRIKKLGKGKPRPKRIKIRNSKQNLSTKHTQHHSGYLARSDARQNYSVKRKAIIFKLQITNSKLQTNPNDQNSKFKTPTPSLILPLPKGGGGHRGRGSRFEFVILNLEFVCDL